MAAGKIDIGSVLNRFDDTVDEKTGAVKTYGIRFLKADGSTRQIICRKNVKTPALKPTGPLPEKGKTMHNLKRKGTIMIHDVENDVIRTPKVCMIYAFKDYKSNTWLNVFH